MQAGILFAQSRALGERILELRLKVLVASHILNDRVVTTGDASTRSENEQRKSCWKDASLPSATEKSGCHLLNPHVQERFCGNPPFPRDRLDPPIEVTIKWNQEGPPLDIYFARGFHHVFLVVSAVVRIPEQPCFLETSEVIWQRASCLQLCPMP